MSKNRSTGKSAGHGITKSMSWKEKGRCQPGIQQKSPLASYRITFMVAKIAPHYCMH
jgi:hypothetical protein